MAAEPVTTTRPTTRTRADRPHPAPRFARLWPWPALLALAGGFVIFGASDLELGDLEARIGLSAGERLGPFGQVFGGWDPSVWPAQVAPCTLWRWAQGGTATPGVVRWPSAIAGVLLGLLMAGRIHRLFGARSALAWGFCWFGSVALIDRSAGAGIDLITALATVATIDRLLTRGPGWVAGLWAGLALLSGGWPPLALIVLALIVMGRQGLSLSFRFLVPPLIAFLGWSAWAWSVTEPEAWGAAFALPLTARSAWLLAPGVLALGLPGSPFALLVAFREAREGWPSASRSYLIAWLQVAGVCLLAGTVLPGLASAARLPALVGIAVAASVGIDRVLGSRESFRLRRTFLGLTMAVVLLWAAIALGWGSRLASEVSYYRGLSVLLIVLAGWILIAAIGACRRGSPALGAGSLILVALCLKLAHWGYYVPESNYRFGQGPWGRAIGQWLPPRWPIYTEHRWSPELAFAIGRPIRQLPHPRHLSYLKGHDPKFVLLVESEFANWPPEAPAIQFVARFQDEHGGTRILARTEGDASWRHLSTASRLR